MLRAALSGDDVPNDGIVRVPFCVASASLGADLSCVECHFAWQVQYRGHPTLHALHFTLRTLHFALYTPHFTLHNLHLTLFTAECNLHSTLYSLHFKIYTPQFTLDTCRLRLFTLHAGFTLCTLHSPLHTLHTQHSTVFTLHTLHSTPFQYTGTGTGKNVQDC